MNNTRKQTEFGRWLSTDEEKRLFRRLAVFVGGRTIEAVEEVYNTDGSLGLDVVDGLLSLVDKSLLRREKGASGEPRFIMLDDPRICQGKIAGVGRGRDYEAGW